MSLSSILVEVNSFLSLSYQLNNGWLKARKCMHTKLLYIFLQDPFEVGFVQTTYTVVESEGAVNVCVNLTKPVEDIGFEMVHVEVFDFSNSMYIPRGVSLAGESNLRCYVCGLKTSYHTFSL